MSAPPILDFSPFYGNDPIAKAQLVQQVKDCCLHNGFFQIIGHQVPSELQTKIFECSKAFFDLPLEEKSKANKDLNTWNRGYELLRSQILEIGTAPELKEGFYIGEDLPTTHPYFISKKLNSGPNFWPSTLSPAAVSLPEFKDTTMSYYHHVVSLAKDILKVLALTLDLDEAWFDGFTEGAVATMRLLHYPPQEKDGEEKLQRGIGAHTDFGAVTLLLQEEVDGLQVWEKETKTWLDVVPTKGAYVVNLGNMFMRWSNDRYVSNLHRVINKSGKERYSIPVFFSGNPDYVINCLPNCCDEGQKPKYPPITVADCVGGSYKESYGRAAAHKAEQEQKGKAMETKTSVPIAV
ncbi:hypothetical protein EG329_010168 [Mollisiaceae sp. DMI_Dod_QoI]|nr:hypothetical protein EG329_010168 [Helotiales sp. DMI_Dod_QoI]